MEIGLLKCICMPTFSKQLVFAFARFVTTQRKVLTMNSLMQFHEIQKHSLNLKVIPFQSDTNNERRSDSSNLTVVYLPADL